MATGIGPSLLGENGKREWLDTNGCFRFGKYKGEFVEDVAERDASYLKWIVTEVEEIDDTDRAIIKTTLSLLGDGE